MVKNTQKLAQHIWNLLPPLIWTDDRGFWSTAAAVSQLLYFVLFFYFSLTSYYFRDLKWPLSFFPIWLTGTAINSTSQPFAHRCMMSYKETIKNRKREGWVEPRHAVEMQHMCECVWRALALKLIICHLSSNKGLNISFPSWQSWKMNCMQQA